MCGILIFFFVKQLLKKHLPKRWLSTLDLYYRTIWCPERDSDFCRNNWNSNSSSWYNMNHCWRTAQVSSLRPSGCSNGIHFWREAGRNRSACRSSCSCCRCSPSPLVCRSTLSPCKITTFLLGACDEDKEQLVSERVNQVLTVLLI